MTKADYKKFKEEQARRREIEMMAYFRKIPAFKVLKYKQLKNLHLHFEAAVKGRGSRLFTQGDKADYIYVV